MMPNRAVNAVTQRVPCYRIAALFLWTLGCNTYDITFKCCCSTILYLQNTTANAESIVVAMSQMQRVQGTHLEQQTDQLY